MINLSTTPNRSALGAMLCALVCGGATPGAPAENPAADTASRDYVLFIGLDVTLEQDGASLRIKHVSGSQAEVVGPGVSRTIPVRRFEGLRTSRETVIATTHVQIDNLKSSSGFSAARDPKREALRRQAAEIGLAEDNAARVARSEARAQNASDLASGASAKASALGTDEARYDAGVRAEDSMRANEDASNTTRTTLSNPKGDYLGNPNPPGMPASNFDALEVTFQASSPDPIKGAYAVLLTVMRLPSAPNEPVMSLAFRPLPPLGPKPRRIDLTHDGLPPGFELDRCEVHLYQGGYEIATNLSERRIQLTREEAFQYLLLRYTMDHTGRDVPPRPVLELLPGDFAARLPAEQRTRVADVHVRADGRVENVRLEPANPGPDDAYFEAILRDAYFYPALVQGRPVATDTTVVLADLAP